MSRLWLCTKLVVPCFIALILNACGGGGGGDANVTPVDSDGDGVVDSVDIDDDNDGLIEISTLEHLDWIRNELTGAMLVDHLGNRMMDGCLNVVCVGYELTADLDFDTNNDGLMDFNDFYFDQDGDGQNNGWLPVGDSVSPFAAIFEGNNHRISNLYINRTGTDTETTGGSDVGLFGVIFGNVGTPIEIRNLTFDGDLTQISGVTSTGALAGQAQGAVEITNLHSDGTVSGSSQRTGGLIGTAVDIDVNNSSVTGGVTGFFLTGGVIGRTDGVTISGCTKSGRPVRGNTFHTGGLVGDAHTGTEIIDSSSSASVIGGFTPGGLVGLLYNSTIRDSMASGPVSGTGNVGGLVAQSRSISEIVGSYALGNANATGESVGGLVGHVFNGPLSITNSFAEGTVTGPRFTGGLVGNNRGELNIASSYATGQVIGTDFVGGLVGAFNLYTTDPATSTDVSILVDIGSIFESFSISAVGSSSGSYVGGLIGISYNTNVLDSFATGSVTTSGQYVGGLIGDANLGTIVNRSFCVNTITGSLDVGALVGYSDSAAYSDNYFANDQGILNALGTNNSAGGLNPTGTTGSSLANLQLVTTAGENGLFTNWGAAWDFGDTSQLPGLLINGMVHRDGDANGVLD